MDIRVDSLAADGEGETVGTGGSGMTVKRRRLIESIQVADLVRRVGIPITTARDSDSL